MNESLVFNTDRIGGPTLLSLVHNISRTPRGRDSWIASVCILSEWMQTGRIYQGEGETMQGAVDAAILQSARENMNDTRIALKSS